MRYFEQILEECLCRVPSPLSEEAKSFLERCIRTSRVEDRCENGELMAGVSDLAQVLYEAPLHLVGLDRLASVLYVHALHITRGMDIRRMLRAMKHHLSDRVYRNMKRDMPTIEAVANIERDFDCTYPGIRVRHEKYLKPEEIPTFQFLRIAWEIWGDLESTRDKAIRLYHLLSRGRVSAATPTQFNGGTKNPQLSSCYLTVIKGDDTEAIMDTAKEHALRSKNSGGLSCDVSLIRAKGSLIRGTGGKSSGIVALLGIFDQTLRTFDQGGGKRNGAEAIYIPPWHADCLDVCHIRVNTNEQQFATLYPGLWVSDLFMERVEYDRWWSFFCPNECPGLSECHGEEFRALYEWYERQGKARKRTRARHLWNDILKCQIESGFPYMCYKDAVNRYNVVPELGTIRSSNLCTEIMEATDQRNAAVCNLFSMCVSAYVTEGSMDWDSLGSDVEFVADCLDRIIDLNFYPVPNDAKNNKQNRPIGIGVQGVADAMLRLRISWLDFDQAEAFHHKMAAHIYFHAKKGSLCDPWLPRPGRFSRVVPLLYSEKFEPHPDYDWEGLAELAEKRGCRNCYVVAYMPTASTSLLLGNCESFEPPYGFIYVRRVLSGSMLIVNEELRETLIKKYGRWDEDTIQNIIQRGGSVSGLDFLTEEDKRLFVGVFEVPLNTQLQLCAVRQRYVDQAQSFNVYMEQPNVTKLGAYHFAAWKAGLKTGMYYLRERPAVEALQYANMPNRLPQKCTEECETCGA